MLLSLLRVNIEMIMHNATVPDNVKMLLEQFSNGQEYLVNSIHQILIESIYAHRSFLRPSKMRRVAEDEVNGLQNFLKQRQIEPVETLAHKHVKLGLAIESVIRISRIVNEFCFTYLDGEVISLGLDAYSQYQSVYMQSYITARETNILEEQEHIRHAMQRSLSHNNLWLTTAAEVSRAATSTLNLNKLLSASVNLIQKHFGFYHVGLFLLDDTREWARLLASKQGAGESLLKRGLKIQIDNSTMVGKCANIGEVQIVTDLRVEEFQHDKSILSATRSALSLPLISREVVIGTIFIQSTDLSKFGNDDIIRLQTVADQVTNAIQNARLYHELEMHNENLAQAVQIRTLELQTTKDRVEAILNNSPDGILLINSNGVIEQCNTISTAMFNHSMNALSGKSIYDLVHSSDVDLVESRIHECLHNRSSMRFQMLAKRSDQSTFDGGVALAVVKTLGTANAIVCSIRDISDTVQAEERIKASLREKEVLLREIHHRVKNNLQVITSLLDLQAGYTTDTEATELLLESQNRVRTMALVHERLYQSQDLAQIDFRTYIKELTTTLFNSYLIDSSRVGLDVDSDTCHLDIDRAIPCGLIINELVSNSLKHAFPEDRTGVIRVHLRSEDNEKFAIIVSDDGIGLPKDLDLDHSETLGLQLVSGLAVQLDATIGVKRQSGTQFEIRFALVSNEEQEND